jgi:hypothetical protein
VPLERLFEGNQQPVLIQLPFEMGNVGLFPIVAAFLVKHLNENGKQSIDIFFADYIGFLIDVEKNALGRNRDCLGDFCREKLVLFLALILKDPANIEPVKRTPSEQQGDHFQKVRLPGTEEPGDPDAVGILIIDVRIQKIVQAKLQLVSDDVFFDFRTETCIVIGFDNTLDGAIDLEFENLAKLHGV